MTDAILSTPAKTYERIASASNEVAARLAARLREETQGEVLFTPSDRGRYATDASIYQVIPLGVFVPRDNHEVGIAMDICRDLGVLLDRDKYPWRCRLRGCRAVQIRLRVLPDKSMHRLHNVPCQRA